MKISQIQELLNAEVVCGEDQLDKDVHSACGSDMMSDVLAYVKDQAVLLTGLVNPQVVRTAEMMDMVCIVFVRSKVPTEEMITLAKEHGMVLLKTRKRMYEACGKLYAAGLEDENGEFIRVSFTGFPNCVFWSPAGAPFTCIEPWFGCDDLAGTDDDFRHRYCINTLLPRNEFEISYYINVL